MQATRHERVQAPPDRVAASNGLLGLFLVLCLVQGGHLVEHVVQVVQFHVLDRPAASSRGLLSFLDTEWVHFVWNTLILALLVPLLVRHRRNGWLWLAFLAAVWHEVEHSYLIFDHVLTGLDGNPGLLADGGLVAGGLDTPRIDLHFFYNVVETVPLFIAWFVARREVRAAAPVDAAEVPGSRRLVATSLAAGLAWAVGLVGVAELVAPADREMHQLRAYATDFPLPLAAPTFVPDGFRLVDGDGPWTTLDLDQDGTFETQRAEILYAPRHHPGMPPLMLSMETQHDLSTLAGGYEQVTLPNGTLAWLSVRADSPWQALLWNAEGLTMGIQASGIPIPELLEVAASMTVVEEA